MRPATDNPELRVTAVWLRRIGDKVHALVEIGGIWRLAIVEHFDGPFSHIAEAVGEHNWPVDEIAHGSITRET